MRLRQLAPVLLLAACTDPDEGLQGSYSVAYDPPRLTSATLECDRLLTYLILDMNDQGDFDLSFNVVDDCTRGGGGYSDSGVTMVGTYSREWQALSFTPEPASAPVFSGTVEGDYVRLVIPPSLGNLAPTEIEVRAGPRHPY